MREFDDIILGAGSAGCSVAAWLTQAGHSILVLKADGRDHNLFIHIAPGYALLYANPAVNWCCSRYAMLRAAAHRPERIFVQWAIDAASVLRPCRERITPDSQRPFARYPNLTFARFPRTCVPWHCQRDTKGPSGRKIPG